MEKRLNDEIPPDIQRKIRFSGAVEEKMEPVYRVIKTGILDKEGFISTYEEIVRGVMPDDPRRYPKNDIGTYSTSVYREKKPCKKFIACLKKGVKTRERYPHPVIVEGYTSDGLVQLTCEREPSNSDPLHIDWWIYQGMNAAVAHNFKIVS